MRGYDVASCGWAGLRGLGKRAKRGTHFPHGPPGAAGTLDAGCWAKDFNTPLSGSSFVGNPLGETCSSRWVLRAKGRTPRFLRRETLEKPEIEDEYHRIARLDGRGFGPFRPKCLIHFDGTLSAGYETLLSPSLSVGGRHWPDAARSQHTGCGHMPNSQRPRLLKPDDPGPPRRPSSRREDRALWSAGGAGRPAPPGRAKRAVGTALAALGIAAGLAALVAALVLLVGDCASRSNGNDPAQGQEWLRDAEQALFTRPPRAG